MLDNRVYTFLKLCETRNYTRTAELLHMTQPAVSQHIKYLESELNTKLFYYDEQRQLQLSPQGDLYLKYALTAAANFAKIKQALSYPASTPHILTIGSMPSMGAELLPLVIAEHLKKEEINISMIYAGNSALYEMLKTGEIDVAILSNLQPLNEFVSKLLFHDKTICVCSRNHPLADKEVYLSDLYSQRLLLGYRGSDFNENLNMLLQKNNSDLSNFSHFLELGHATAIKNQLACSDGISFMYSVIFQKELQSGLLKQIHIKDFTASHSIYYCYQRGSIFEDIYISFAETLLRYVSNHQFYNKNISL